MTGDKRIETGKTRQQEEEDEQQEVFYHVGSDDLQACRMDIAKYALIVDALSANCSLLITYLFWYKTLEI